MNIRSLFILILMMMLSAFSFAQRISLSVRQAPIRQVFAELKAQSGYNFVYSENDLKNARPVTLKISSANFEEVLKKVFEGQPLTYMISTRTVVIKARPSGALEKIKSFLRTLTGTVTNSKGEALAGVTVAVQHLKRQTATDDKGSFTLADVPADALIEVNYIGYETQLISLTGLQGTELDIRLQQSVNALEEVVMVGYGSSKRKDLTGAVSSVNMENLKNTAYTSVDQALSGQAAGVQVVQGDGSPGGLAKIRIRGAASIIGGNDPLYVIDGVQVTIENRYIQAAADLTHPIEYLTLDPSARTTVGSSYSRGLNTLALLNINDIESIDILKDASATAIFGSKAANGVVIITTKKGVRNQKSAVEVNYYQAFSTPRTLNVLNGPEYASILKEGAANLNRMQDESGLPHYYIAESILSDPAYFQNNTNWIDLVTRVGQVQNADINIRGGGNDSRYYTSFSYNRSTGVVLGTDFSRIAGKISIDNDINTHIRLLSNLDYGFTSNNISNGVYTSAVLAPPNFAPFEPDGSPKKFLSGFEGSFLAEGVQNPFNLLQGRNHANTATLLGSLSLEYDIRKSLKFKSTFALNYNTYRQYNYVPATVFIAAPDPSPNGGITTQGETQETALFYENTLTWEKQFNPRNRLVLLGGASWQQSKLNTFSTYHPAQLSDRAALLSFYLRANYAYSDKYLVTFTGRSDASSKFPVNNRVGYFPSAGLAWLINEESFLKDVSWLSQLKLRASAGLTGTQNIADNLFYTIYTEAIYAGSKAVVASQLGNDQTKWETTLQKDAGIDFALFDFRLRGSFGYYSKRSADLLIALQVPSSSGYTTAIQNYGTIRNRGLELELGADIIKNKSFQWNTTLNVSGNRSRVLKLNQTLSDPLKTPLFNEFAVNTLGNTILTEGEPVGAIYGTRYLGVNAAGEPRFQTVSSGPSAGRPEKMIIGKAEPEFFGGFTNTFSYKRFSLLTLFSFSYGGDLIYLPRGNDLGLPDITNHLRDILDHHSGDNPQSHNPALVLGQIGAQQGISTFNVFDASYIKLKSLVFSYNLPQMILDKLRIRSASIYLAGNNLLIISKYPGPDPEVSNNPYSLIGGYTDDASYPTLRQYSFGLRFNL
ncbi:SusC/RagA family TonB-linked outer membrane protein [Pedobacter sp. MC2016-15]|uniref:SusC/RagA family TonB-linked outer membrane protein n=1 Tax=Pedobacter sp. MC2016-15 TaxID=2994473 RepID=UPI0022482545|nr:SusC/RagA family TonB-linked outer membrane protein [Pedobacter sp. MC2016-15]MCX2480273.1 SusC/RagA family TonB-linked outer membrane protein [Pedobacter sp. MC2016-15]